MAGIRCITVIAGRTDDSIFAGLCFVADSLSYKLPNFHFRNICKDPSDWESWLHDLCAQYGWTHQRSPLVWREIGINRENVYYVGGAYQFWDLLSRYYNITSFLSKKDMEDLQCDFTSALEIQEKIRTLHPKNEWCRITIIGAGKTICFDLVPQLIRIRELWKLHGIIVYLYDEPGHSSKLKEIAKKVETAGYSSQSTVIVNSLETLRDSDILIYLDTVSREENESIENWLLRNYDIMKELSANINLLASNEMKVILCSEGPVCYNVNVLHNLVRKVSKTNIIAVTAHYGLEVMETFVNSFGFNSRDFGSPPVWGFVGINRFVDFSHMVQKYDVLQPNKKTAMFIEASTLPFATKHSELRWFSYMAHNKNLHKQQVSENNSGRDVDFEKCKTICDLLKFWYKGEAEAGDEIISLGIASDGSFGIPKGLVFSQPAYLKLSEDHSREWMPFSEFPMPDMPLAIFQNLVETAVILTSRFNQDNNF